MNLLQINENKGKAPASDRVSGDRLPDFNPCSLIYILKVLWNANACWLVLIYNTLIITNVAKRLFKYVPYILL